MTPDQKYPDHATPAASTDALWGVTCVLGDIARRVARRRAAEHATETPETRRGAGSDPLPRGEATR